jgi:conjugal transfer/entry exclusion protein
MTDWETRYYEAQASHTEANGMLTMERDHWKAKAEGLRESMRLDAETMAAKDAEIARLTSCISETVNERDEARGAAVKANRAVERLHGLLREMKAAMLGYPMSTRALSPTRLLEAINKELREPAEATK